MHLRKFVSLFLYFHVFVYDRALQPLFFYFEILKLKLLIDLPYFVVDAKELTLYFQYVEQTDPLPYLFNLFYFLLTFWIWVSLTFEFCYWFLHFLIKPEFLQTDIMQVQKRIFIFAYFRHKNFWIDFEKIDV